MESLVLQNKATIRGFLYIFSTGEDRRIGQPDETDEVLFKTDYSDKRFCFSLGIGLVLLLDKNLSKT